MRVSGGRGHVAPTPFTEDLDTTGLTPVVVSRPLAPEDATSVGGDLTWRHVPFEVTGTLFRSRIAHPLAFREATGDAPAQIVNATRPTTAQGTEFIARYHEDDLDIIVTHMYLWSTGEEPETGLRREVPLNPRHTASFDALWEKGHSQIGLEAFYTGRQALERDPYRDTSPDYLLWGVLFTHRVGRALLYVNTENLGDVRQTTWSPLLRPRPLGDARWITDAWGPIDGRAINAGVRVKF